MSGASFDTNQTLDALLHQILNQALVRIGADQGSLMLVDDQHELLQIKARLGPPHPGRRDEPVFRLSDTTIASLVAKTAEPYLCADVQKDPHFKSSRSGANFRCLLSVPIVHQGHAIAVVNADAAAANHFTADHVAALEALARDAAKPIAEKSSVGQELATIGMDLSKLSREGGIDDVLQRIADAAVRSLGANAVTLYQYQQASDEFLVKGTGPTIAGTLNDPAPMRRDLYKDDVPYIMVRNRESGFYPDVSQHQSLSQSVTRPGQAPRLRFVEREGIKSMAALLLPYRAATDPDQEIVGVMFANYRSPHAFNSDEITALATFADFAAVAIQNARDEERRLRERVEAEERRSRLEIVTSLSSGLAHRMSKLFAPARLAAQHLEEKLAPDDIVGRAQLQRIVRQADVLFGLAKHMAQRLTETRAPHQVVELELRKCVQDALRALEEELQGIEVTEEIPEDLPKVYCDPYQLPHVLDDLFRNAIEAIDAAASGDGDSRPKRLRLVAKDERAGRVALSIYDSGGGVPVAQRDRVFLPGEGTKGTLGIGLWWSQAFMRSIEGDLSLKQPQPIDGSCFVLRFRASTPPLAASELRPEEPRRVLIVEDDPEFTDALAQSLQDLPCVFERAQSVAAARRLLEQHRFAAVVLDVALTDDHEDRQGLEVLSFLDSVAPNTPAIILSQHSEQVRDRVGRYASVCGVLNKNELRLGEMRGLLRPVLNPPTGAPAH